MKEKYQAFKRKLLGEALHYDEELTENTPHVKAKLQVGDLRGEKARAVLQALTQVSSEIRKGALLWWH